MPIVVRGVTTLLQVYDMPASVRFYRDLLGFEVLNTSPILDNGSFHWAWLRLGQADLMLNTAYEFDSERPPKPEPARMAAHEDTGLFFECSDVDAAYEELRGKGVMVSEPATARYGMKQMFFRDPDGYALCLQSPVKIQNLK